MNKLNLVLGIDSSTQGTAAVVLDRRTLAVVESKKLNFRDDERLSRYLPPGASTPVLIAREPGEADQDPMMYLAALGALFDELGPAVLSRVAAIGVSAQQHGQVWVTREGVKAIAALKDSEHPASTAWDPASFPSGGFAERRTPIWMTSSTAREADHIRSACGGVEEVTRRSGSNSPLRFSGAVLRRIALQRPDVYARAARVHLISSFLTAILCGDPEAPIDWGNGSGMTLMNWTDRTWDRVLLRAVAQGLPGGDEGLLSRLPRLAHPLEIVGRIAPRLVERFGFQDRCVIVAGSGDNPQTKVLSEGDLLSLGTSFVTMTASDAPHPSANAMYDGLGRPFHFGCRTNGALAWEAVRIRHGLDSGDFSESDAALSTHPVGTTAPDFIFQPEVESFPESPRNVPPKRTSFALEYASVVDTSLSLLHLASRPLTREFGPIVVAGGSATSTGVLHRVATIWGRPVAKLADAGAGTGAAVGAAMALETDAGRADAAERARQRFLVNLHTVVPDATATAALRAPGGYFQRLTRAFTDLGGRPTWEL